MEIKRIIYQINRINLHNWKNDGKMKKPVNKWEVYHEFRLLIPQFPQDILSIYPGPENNGVTTLGIGDEPYDQLS